MAYWKLTKELDQILVWKGWLKLNPVFDENGIVTAGNAKQIQTVHLLVW